MARRAPGAVRRRVPHRQARRRRFSEVRGLSGKGRAAVRHVEAQQFCPGYLSDALAQYEDALRRPGRWVDLPMDGCPCHDPVDARDRLQDMLDALPRAARGQLRRRVARLDAEFAARTLPDPHAVGRTPTAWWQRRLTGW